MSQLLLALPFLALSAVSTPEDKKDFELDGELGLIITTGNTDTSSLRGKLNSHHEMDSWSNDYVFEGFYSREEVDGEDGVRLSQTTAQRFFASAQGNYKLTNPDNRLFVFASYRNDRFNGFDFQSTVSAGWNSQLWDNKQSRFSYSLGPGYSYAQTDAGEDASGIIIRGAANYLWRISDNATFRQQVSTESGSENTTSKSETSLTTKINGSMSMKVALILNHNSQVAEGIENLDTETAVTLVYHFF